MWERTVIATIRSAEHGCFFFFQAEDGIRDLTVTGVRRVLFRSAWGVRLRRRGPAPAAAVRPRRDGLRSASARCWGISRSRSRAAGPRCPTSPGPPRTATRTRAWPPPPRACAGGAMETACAPPSGRGLRLGSSDLHIPPFRPQLGHEDGPELAGVVALPGAMLGAQARGRRVGVPPRRCEVAVGERRQAAVEPPRYRHREAALAPPDHVVGHEPARRFL